MTGRTTSSFREDDRDHLFDLPAFEMPAKKKHIDETNLTEVNRCPQGSNQSQNTQIGTASFDVEKSQIAETSPLLVSNEACCRRRSLIRSPKVVRRAQQQE